MTKNLFTTLWQQKRLQFTDRNIPYIQNQVNHSVENNNGATNSHHYYNYIINQVQEFNITVIYSNTSFRITFREPSRALFLLKDDLEGEVSFIEEKIGEIFGDLV